MSVKVGGPTQQSPRRLHPLSFPIGGGKGRDGDVKSPLLIPGTNDSGCKQRIAFAGEGLGREGKLETRKQKLEWEGEDYLSSQREAGGGSLIVALMPWPSTMV